MDIDPLFQINGFWVILSVVSFAFTMVIVVVVARFLRRRL